MILQGGLVTVRWFDETDLSALVGVHGACFPGERWRKEDFRRFADKPGQIVRSVVMDGKVVGSFLYRNKQDDVQIARVGVLPEYRRAGVATAAISMLTGENSPNRKRVVRAVVREHNLAAQLLLRKLGFAYDGKVSGKYGPSEIVMADGQTLTTAEDGYAFSLEKADQRRRRAAGRQDAGWAGWAACG